MTKIVYRADDGSVTIIAPAADQYMPVNPSTGVPYTIDEVAAKDVPTGKKFKKMEDSEFPTDETFRDAWTVDEADLTDGVGA